MPTSNQSKKRVRQNEKRRLHNKALSSTYRTAIKRLLELVKAGDKDKDKAQEAQALFPRVMAEIDKAAKSRVIHPNTAARRKSLISRALRDIGKTKKA